ncbi:acyl-CoA dehydrogenase family protein [Phenylobacterium montanum]|uniref:Acyl-CoA dehydrogenase family protein n=2 Tax=Phenylobacterium montanum TaxID=2823693 RepID=A0A975G545_9CAUL|nr:acyl-CoA dehydrogenase family protein [Caulobacter sp. S6]
MDWRTHEIENQVNELVDYDLFSTDAALVEAVARVGGDWFANTLGDYGAELGRTETWRMAADANRLTPELERYDARGRRIDQVSFHPSWHAILELYRNRGLVSLPFRDELRGRWGAWVAGFYLHGQIEAGTLCPATMTQAAIPLLQKEPALWATVGDKLYSDRYDPRDLPIRDKASIWIGMGMTEKQGGSDVRSNTTAATPVGVGGRGGEYLLRGHKWFFSVPTSDAHLVVAKTPDGSPSCFFVPRYRPDGSRNAIRVQRLKEKVGNRSNASSEVEFEDAWGVLMGEPGRGIPTIIEMAGYTRLNCVVGSAAMLRQALVQALAYTRKRRAFGRALADQPLMRAVLADLALESEAALVLAMRLAEAFEAGDDPAQRAWKRIMTPAAKFWVCKRAVEACGEAMEALGGNGYVEPGVMGRFYREAPVNSIWEGSGNVMCLDVIRAMAREPESATALLDDLAPSGGGEAPIRAELAALRDLLTGDPEVLEGRGRRIAQRLVLVAQAALLRERAPSFVADGFIATRFAPDWGRVIGGIDPAGLDVEPLLARAFPT